jgi:hypothetical protein
MTYNYFYVLRAAPLPGTHPHNARYMEKGIFDSARMLPFSFMNSVPRSETLLLHFPPSVSITGWGREGHGLINYIETKAKCRHL